MIDIAGQTAYRLDLAQDILSDQTDEHFAVLAGADGANNSMAMSLRHLNLLRAFSSPGNARLFDSDAAWNAGYRETQISPALFFGRHTEAWLTRASRANLEERLVLTVRTADRLWDLQTTMTAAQAAALGPRERQPAFTTEDFDEDTSICSAMDWIGFAGGFLDVSAHVPPPAPLTMRAQSFEVPISSATLLPLTAFGGRGDYSFGPAPGQLTPYLRLISGTVTVQPRLVLALAGRTFKFVVRVTDAGLGAAEAPVTVTVVADPVG